MTNLLEQPQSAIRVLRKRQLCKLLGISPASLDRLRARGDFPAPLFLSVQSIAWTIESVQAWLSSRAVAHHFVESI
jgi:predicted DNA-binding transcriptional regulator AlpA